MPCVHRTMQLYYSAVALSVVLIKSMLTTRQITWVNWVAVILSMAVFIGTVFALGLSVPYAGASERHGWSFCPRAHALF